MAGMESLVEDSPTNRNLDTGLVSKVLLDNLPIPQSVEQEAEGRVKRRPQDDTFIGMDGPKIIPLRSEISCDDDQSEDSDFHQQLDNLIKGKGSLELIEPVSKEKENVTEKEYIDTLKEASREDQQFPINRPILIPDPGGIEEFPGQIHPVTYSGIIEQQISEGEIRMSEEELARSHLIIDISENATEEHDEEDYEDYEEEEQYDEWELDWKKKEQYKPYSFTSRKRLFRLKTQRRRVFG